MRPSRLLLYFSSVLLFPMSQAVFASPDAEAMVAKLFMTPPPFSMHNVFYAAPDCKRPRIMLTLAYMKKPGEIVAMDKTRYGIYLHRIDAGDPYVEGKGAMLAKASWSEPGVLRFDGIVKSVLTFKPAAGDKPASVASPMAGYASEGGAMPFVTDDLPEPVLVRCEGNDGSAILGKAIGTVGRMPMR